MDRESYTVRDGDRSVTKYRDLPRWGKNIFFEIRVEVFNFGGHVQPGQYSFPFSFVLPHGLPGVFNATGRDQSEARVEYRLRSECCVGGIFNSDLHHTQYLVVNERLNEGINAMVHEKNVTVNCCCCFGRGDASLRTKMDKSCYNPGETAQIVCDVANRSSEAFPIVRVRLERTLLLRDNHGHRHWVKNVVSENDYAGVPENTERLGPNALYLPLNLSSGIYPTTRGRLVECTYAVDVQFAAKGCCVSNLDVRTPVRIYAPLPPPAAFYQQPPPGWSPHVMNPTSVSLPPPPANVLPPPAGAIVDQPSAPPPSYHQAPPPYPGGSSIRSPLLGGKS